MVNVICSGFRMRWCWNTRRVRAESVGDYPGVGREGEEVTPPPPPCGPPLPRGEGNGSSRVGAFAPRDDYYLLRGEKVDRDRRPHQPSRAG